MAATPVGIKKKTTLRIFSKTTRPSRTAWKMAAKLSSVTTMSEASLATSVPLRPMATPEVCGPQGRRIVDAVARDGHDLPVVHQLPDDPQLVVRGHACVDGNRFDPVEEVLVRHLLDLASRDHAISPSVSIPTILAMAKAVVGWSPVIMMTRMPARLQSRTASTASSRGGSIMAWMPARVRSCSTSSCRSSRQVVGRPLVSHGQHAHPLRGEPVRDLQDLFRAEAVALPCR